MEFPNCRYKQKPKYKKEKVLLFFFFFEGLGSFQVQLSLCICLIWTFCRFYFETTVKRVAMKQNKNRDHFRKRFAQKALKILSSTCT